VIAGSTEQLSPPAAAEILRTLDEIVEIEVSLLLDAGLSLESANHLANSTRLTAERYRELRTADRPLNSEQLRPGFERHQAGTSCCTSSAQRRRWRCADRDRRRRCPPPFGVTLLSVLTGAAQAGEAAQGD
jgi:hypothetical protein